MCRLLAVLAITAALFMATGCGEKQPEADPNWQPTTNPSDIQIPDQMKTGGKASPGAPGKPAIP